MPVDVELFVKSLMERYFPDGIPIGKTGKLDALDKIAAIDNINYDEEEVRQVLESKEATSVQQSDFMSTLGLGRGTE